MSQSVTRGAILWLARMLIALAVLALVGNVHADDLADEADLQFQLGADRYDAADYRGALEHFLASNRLVRNRKVIFNIAATYEQLKRLPDAYRYYAEALEGEKDPATRQSVEDALARLRPRVALLTVESDPPGAVVYLDRKDLGARGSTPRTLAFPSGSHKVIVELAGYAPAEAPSVELLVGVERKIKLALVPILGTVRVEGQPAGAQIRIDREDAPVAGTVPGSFSLPPGKHALFVSREDFQPASVLVDVPANGRTTAHVRLSPLTGVVVVGADIRDALITIDDKPSGFTPAVMTVAQGRHRVRVSYAGHRPVDSVLTVKQGEQTRLDVQLIPVEEVTAASRTTEATEDAPASVTTISARELRAMAYPTIAEAIRGIRGLYLSDDRNYVAVGVRGYGRPGDYGNHVLVLVDGMPTNDNYIGSSYVGYDARVDIDDVEAIEVVRGPGSALYGGSAFFGVINLVTRSRQGKTHGEVGISTADSGTFRSRGTGYLRLGPDSGVWTSASGAQSRGSDYFFPEYVANPTDPNAELGANGLPVDGQARGLDGMSAGTLNGRFWHKALSVQWLFTSRKKKVPTGVFGSMFGDPRNQLSDTRGLLEARFEPRLSSQVQLLSRGQANFYNYTDRLMYAAPEGEARDAFRGRWGGLEQRVVYAPSAAIRFTVGGELVRHFQTLQQGRTAAGPTLFNDQNVLVPERDDPYTVAAGYLLSDWNASRALKISAGARLDYYSNLHPFQFLPPFSPRLGIVFKPYDGGNVKLLGGKAFRAPSVYELYYGGVDQLRASGLVPEQVWSGEVEFSHRFSPVVVATVAVYSNYVKDLIELRSADATHLQYRNAGAPVLLMGSEYELRRDWRQGWMLAASVSLQRAQYTSDDSRRRVPNSPPYLASIRGAIPIVGRSLMLMSRVSIEGVRYDRFDSVTEEAQGTTDAGVIWDLVFSGEVEGSRLRYAIGAYNLADWKYDTAVSGEFRQRTIVQSGRTMISSISATF
ncbi:MAG: TonB-dependent receptor [Deltaproteobacteria bacterium]|nr:TonB-dependent receptor [Deltaproteobacteria bacterium]